MRSLTTFLLFAFLAGAAIAKEIPHKTVKITDAEYLNDGAQIRLVGFRSNARYVLTCDVSYWNAHKDLLGTCEIPEVGRTYKLLPLTRKDTYYILGEA